MTKNTCLNCSHPEISDVYTIHVVAEAIEDFEKWLNMAESKRDGWKVSGKLIPGQDERHRSIEFSMEQIGD